MQWLSGDVLHPLEQLCGTTCICVAIGFQNSLVALSVSIVLPYYRQRVIYPTQKGHKWENLSYPLKKRALDLLIALNKYQIHVHPRGSYSLREGC